MKLGRETVAAILTASCVHAAAALADEDYQAKSYTSAGGKTLNYRIHLPSKPDPAAKYPLVLFLHGAGERGGDNKRQMVHGTAAILDYTIKSNCPAIIVAPQCPDGKQWVDTPWSDLSHTMPESPSEPMRLTIELLQQIIKEQPVDAKRVYVTGLSMGGFGAWDILQRKPGLFAAAIPICGGGDTALAKQIAGVPVWAFHGGADGSVKTKRSRDMIDALKNAGGKPLYTEYDGVGHDSWTRTYADSKVMNWLFDQKKK